jgi:hypothetical protein
MDSLYDAQLNFIADEDERQAVDVEAWSNGTVTLTAYGKWCQEIVLTPDLARQVVDMLQQAIAAVEA